MPFNREEFDRMYRYCLALTGNAADASDLLQESFKNYLSRKKTSVTSPLRYLFRVIRNQHIDTIRSQLTIELEEFEEESSEITHIDWKSIEEILIDQEQARQLLAHVSSEEREILFLWAVEEFTAQEIAQQLECPLGTVLSKLHRLRKKIRNYLDETSSEEVKGAS